MKTHTFAEGMANMELTICSASALTRKQTSKSTNIAVPIGLKPLPTLPEREQLDFQKQFNRTREVFLDTCQGLCYLKRPEVAQIVADSLLHFDGVRYRMGDFVIMPNHVHLLAVIPSAEALADQCKSWMHYTAVQINRLVREKGKFWQQEAFDHLVRSPEQYEYLRRYIAENPMKANLKVGQYLYRRWEG